MKSKQKSTFRTVTIELETSKEVEDLREALFFSSQSHLKPSNKLAKKLRDKLKKYV